MLHPFSVDTQKIKPIITQARLKSISSLI